MLLFLRAKHIFRHSSQVLFRIEQTYNFIFTCGPGLPLRKMCLSGKREREREIEQTHAHTLFSGNSGTYASHGTRYFYSISRKTFRTYSDISCWLSYPAEYFWIQYSTYFKPCKFKHKLFYFSKENTQRLLNNNKAIYIQMWNSFIVKTY